jgi:hypothetical protein
VQIANVKKERDIMERLNESPWIAKLVREMMCIV